MSMTLSIDAFKRNFFLNESPFWWAYDAFSRSKLLAKFRNDDDEISEGDLMEYSWLQLEELFESYDAGEVNIVLKKNPSDNTKNALTYRVKWGGGVSGHRNPSARVGGMQGNNAQMFQMMQMMMQMNNEHHAVVLDQGNRLAQLQYENMRLEEALENNSAPTMGETVIQEIGSIARAVMGGGAEPQRSSALGSMGDEGQEKGTIKIDPQALIDDCVELQKLMPEYHINDVIKALLNFAKNNPGQVKFFIGPLLKK